MTSRGIEACAEILGISAAEVSGVATFYTMYKRRPVGDYHVGVCTNTLCAIMGGDLIFERLKDHLDVGNDETTEDGKVTLEHVECNAACDFAPGDDGQLGVHGQHDARVGRPAGRRPALGRRGALHPRPAAGHLARGRAGARRLPRRPRRRGPVRRTGLPGGPEDRPRARLDRPDGQAGRSSRSGRPTPPRATPPPTRPWAATRPSTPSPRPRSRSPAADAKHEDNPANPGGDDK